MTGVNKVASCEKPGELIIKDLPIPTASDDSIVIKTQLVGINFADIYQLNGILNLTGSNILGLESVGEIIEVGKNITQFKVGDRVFNGTGSSYASYRVVDSHSFSRVTKLPEYTTYEQAIGLGIQGLTAYALAYKEYVVNKNDFVLVQAAAGGVGMLLVQLLANQGAKVIGAVSTQEKADFVKKYGAEYTINYSTENIAERVKEITGGKGVSVVYDSIGNTTYNASLESLAVGGLLVQCGWASGVPEAGLPSYFIGKHLKIHGFEVSAFEKEGDGFNEWLLDMFEQIHSGSLKTFISKEYTLDQTVQAFEDMKGRKTLGKLVIKP